MGWWLSLFASLPFGLVLILVDGHEVLGSTFQDSRFLLKIKVKNRIGTRQPDHVDLIPGSYRLFKREI